MFCIKTTSLCLFGDCKSESKQKRGEFVLKRRRKRMYVCRSRRQFSQSLRDVWKLLKEKCALGPSRLFFDPWDARAILDVSLHSSCPGTHPNQYTNTRAYFWLNNSSFPVLITRDNGYIAVLVQWCLEYNLLKMCLLSITF